MCGRFTLRASPKDVADLFFVDVQLELLPRFNIAPTQEVLAIRAAVDRRHAGATGREAAKVRLPAAKVVVYIDHQDIYVVGSLFKLGDVFRHRQRVLQELVPFWKLRSLITSISSRATSDLSGALPWRSSFLLGIAAFLLILFGCSR